MKKNPSTKKSIKIHPWWSIIICSVGGQTNSPLLMERFSSRVSVAKLRFGKLAVTYFNCESGQQWRKWPTVGSEPTQASFRYHTVKSTQNWSWETGIRVLRMCDSHLHPQWKWATAVAAQKERKMPKKQTLTETFRTKGINVQHLR